MDIDKLLEGVLLSSYAQDAVSTLDEHIYVITLVRDVIKKIGEGGTSDFTKALALELAISYMKGRAHFSVVKEFGDMLYDRGYV